jgi:acyl carrier protein
MANAANNVVELITSRSSYSGGALQLSDRLDKLGFDSLELVSLIFDMEEKFNIELPFNANLDIQGKTVADLVQAVELLVAAKVKPA